MAEKMRVLFVTVLTLGINSWNIKVSGGKFSHHTFRSFRLWEILISSCSLYHTHSKEWRPTLILQIWFDFLWSWWKVLSTSKKLIIESLKKVKGRKDLMQYFVSVGNAVTKPKTASVFLNFYGFCQSEEYPTDRMSFRCFVILFFGRLLSGSIRRSWLWKSKNFLLSTAMNKITWNISTNIVKDFWWRLFFTTDNKIAWIPINKNKIYLKCIISFSV